MFTKKETKQRIEENNRFYFDAENSPNCVTCVERSIAKIPYTQCNLYKLVGDVCIPALSTPEESYYW